MNTKGLSRNSKKQFRKFLLGYLPLKIMFSTQSIFANPLFGISTRMDPSFSHKSSLESEKVEKNENLVAVISWDSFLDMRTYVRTVV